MNTNLTIRTEATLQETKFADLATIYNEFATELDIKPIKKFRDKLTGIKRVLDIQADYSEQAKPEVKSKHRKYDLSKNLNMVDNNYKPRENSINSFIIGHISSESYNSAEEIVSEIMNNFRRPTDKARVDRAFARTSVIWLIKENIIKLV